MGAFKSPAEFVAWPPTVFPRSFGYLKNFETVFTQLPMLRYFWNTLVVSVFSTVIKLVIALLAAYAFVYFDFAGKKALFFLLLGTMMLPPDTLTITNYQTVCSCSGSTFFPLPSLFEKRRRWTAAAICALSLSS